jgi:hypothetical protein
LSLTVLDLRTEDRYQQRRRHQAQRGTRREFIELPTGSANAIWSEAEVTFDVLGQSGLGLTMVVPDGRGGVRDVPVYGPDGPWRQKPPEGASFTSDAELDELRTASQTLF